MGLKDVRYSYVVENGSFFRNVPGFCDVIS